MNIRLVFSWLALIGGGVYGAYLSYAGRVATDPLVSALFGAYSSWGLYWGIPVLLIWWLGLDFGPELSRRLLKLLLGFVFVPLLGYLYGVLGGGLYRWIRASGQARH